MYSLIIIGGGAVACGYDSPNDKDIITHIHGALLHPKIHLNAIVELKKDRREYIMGLALTNKVTIWFANEEFCLTDVYKRVYICYCTSHVVESCYPQTSRALV